jgi:hypothetical protein
MRDNENLNKIMGALFALTLVGIATSNETILLVAFVLMIVAKIWTFLMPRQETLKVIDA